MCSGSEAGSYLSLKDSCITQLTAQGPSRTCNESQEEEKKAEKKGGGGALRAVLLLPVQELPCRERLRINKTVTARVWLGLSHVQTKVFKTIQVVPFPLGGGMRIRFEELLTTYWSESTLSSRLFGGPASRHGSLHSLSWRVCTCR